MLSAHVCVCMCTAKLRQIVVHVEYFSSFLKLFPSTFMSHQIPLNLMSFEWHQRDTVGRVRHQHDVWTQMMMMMKMILPQCFECDRGSGGFWNLQLQFIFNELPSGMYESIEGCFYCVELSLGCHMGKYELIFVCIAFYSSFWTMLGLPWSGMSNVALNIQYML